MKKFGLIILLAFLSLGFAQGQKISTKKTDGSGMDIVTESTYMKVSIPFAQLPTGNELADALYSRLPKLAQTQTSLQLASMKQSPGGYHFRDYWRMGLPLEILVIAVAVPTILWAWPL